MVKLHTTASSTASQNQLSPAGRRPWAYMYPSTAPAYSRLKTARGSIQPPKRPACHQHSQKA